MLITTALDTSMLLREAVDRLIDGIPVTRLRAPAARLTAAYRRGGSTVAMRSEADRLAYAAVRLPATFAAMRAVLAELRQRAPDVNPRSLLDLGAGPATALWSTWATWQHLDRATHVDRDPAMAYLAERLLTGTPVAGQVHSAWETLDLASPAASDRVRGLGGHDLVLLGYLLGELPDMQRAPLIDAAWEAAAGALVIIEPGTPAGAAVVIAARSRLVAHGAVVAAPCPHGDACPLPDDDWCHFGVRLNRSSALRRIKQGSLGYEDEKYSYVVVTRRAAAACGARVLRRPRTEKGHVTLHLCERDGTRRAVITRRERDQFRAARKVAWGDGWQP